MNDTPTAPDGALQRSTAPELDRVFDVLRHPIRRRILTELDEANSRGEDEFTLEQLQGEDEDLEPFATKLSHVHLPKLENVGYVEWDRNANTITHGSNYDEIAPLVDLMRDHEDELPVSWP